MEAAKRRRSSSSNSNNKNKRVCLVESDQDSSDDDGDWQIGNEEEGNNEKSFELTALSSFAKAHAGTRSSYRGLKARMDFLQRKKPSDGDFWPEGVDALAHACDETHQLKEIAKLEEQQAPDAAQRDAKLKLLLSAHCISIATRLRLVHDLRYSRHALSSAEQQQLPQIRSDLKPEDFLLYGWHEEAQRLTSLHAVLAKRVDELAERGVSVRGIAPSLRDFVFGDFLTQSHETKMRLSLALSRARAAQRVQALLAPWLRKPSVVRLFRDRRLTSRRALGQKEFPKRQLQRIVDSLDHVERFERAMETVMPVLGPMLAPFDAYSLRVAFLGKRFAEDAVLLTPGRLFGPFEMSHYRAKKKFKREKTYKRKLEAKETVYQALPSML